MITVRKLFSLKDGTRERKIIRILSDWEIGLGQGRLPDPLWLRDFTKALEQEKALGGDIRILEEIRIFASSALPADHEALLFSLNRLRHRFMTYMDIAPADWDMINPEDGKDGVKRTFPFSLYLDDLRSPFNVGSVFRTAECLGVTRIYLSPGTADPDHLRARRTAMGCTERIPWSRLDYKGLEALGETVFAMELGGAELDEFSFPEKGIMVLGSEELGVSPECMALAKKTGGTVSIPLYGNKASLNVSVAFGIVMNAWASSFA